MAKARERQVRWIVYNNEAEYLFESEDAASAWMAQPICLGQYKCRKAVVARCPCCCTFHVVKNNESVTKLRQGSVEGGKP